MSYIGLGPEYDGQVNKKRFVATEGQTTFVVPFDGAVDVYVNGVRLDTSDYTATVGSGLVVLNTGAAEGDVVVVDAFVMFKAADHYTKAESDTLLADKADAVSVYTKAETDANIAVESSVVNKSLYSSSGYTTKVKQVDRWLETNTPNVLVDKVGDDYVIDGVVYSKPTTEQATLPLAPFATGSTDELLDDSVNGLTTQVAHSKGDIVVTGNELVTNGTFDTDLSGWDNISGWWTYDSTNNRAYHPATNLHKPFLQDLGLVLSQDYTITVDIVVVQGEAKISLGDSDGVTSVVLLDGITTSGTYTIEANSVTKQYLIFNRGGSVVTSEYYVDNISVRLADTTYQAITDTSAGDLLSDTSKFQVIPDVTRHDLVTMTPSGYKTFKGINFYQDDTLDNDLIASDRGWSKLGNNTYVDEDGDKCFIVGIVPRLNAGAFHPDYNFYGTGQQINNTLNGYVYWYISNALLNTSTFKSFMNYTDGGVADFPAKLGSITQPIGDGLRGRPDSKYYDKFYNMGEGGLISNYCYAKDDVSFRDDEGEYVRSGVECVEYISEAYGTATSTLLSFTISNTSNIKVGDTLYHQQPANGYYKLTITEVTDSIHVVCSLIGGGSFTRTLGNLNIVTKKSPTHITKGQQLTTDLIGNPTNYPSFLKNTLASGKSVHINPLLVEG